MGMKPQVFLKNGDKIKLSIDTSRRTKFKSCFLE